MPWGVPLPNISDYTHHHNRHKCFVSDTFYLQHLQLTNYCLLLQRGDNPRGIEIFVYIWLMILVVYSVHAPTEKISAFHSFQIVAKSSPPKTQQSPTKRGSWRSDCGESYCRRSPETPARCLLTGLEVAKGWPLKSRKTKITCLNTTINSHNNEEITMFLTGNTSSNNSCSSARLVYPKVYLVPWNPAWFMAGQPTPP